MIRIHYVNLGYYAAEEFTGLDAAVAYARGHGFEASFWQGPTLLGSWSPIGGLRTERAAGRP